MYNIHKYLFEHHHETTHQKQIKIQIYNVTSNNKQHSKLERKKNPFPTNELIQSNQEDFKRKSNYDIQKNWVSPKAVSPRNERKSFT